MEVLDPGHTYRLASLDGPMSSGRLLDILQFVKREGDGYPGNVGHYHGTTTQEVLRALIDRTMYVDGQIYDPRNESVLYHLRRAIYLLEERAADRHGRSFVLTGAQVGAIENMLTCEKCNHIGCYGTCR